MLQQVGFARLAQANQQPAQVLQPLASAITRSGHCLRSAPPYHPSHFFTA